MIDIDKLEGTAAAGFRTYHPDTIIALIAEVRALLEAQLPSGHVAVPIEPTDEILYAGYGHHYRLETTLGKKAAREDYAEMIQAARGAKCST